ncbi:cupin domain-containing protein [Patescibacteria group bacterium]
MQIEKIKVIKSDKRGMIYDCGKSSFIARKKGTISADHKHEDSEIVYLVKGKIELTIEKETRIIKAPARFESGPNIYHKLIALTDIELVIDRDKEKIQVSQ